MLKELSIKNFAIIDDLKVSFEQGMTVLTGETGAGKSIIIDAIQLLVGGRGSQDFVRHGEVKAEIEGLFYLEDKNHQCYEKIKEFGLNIEEGMLIIRREISNKGISVCRVNGKLVTIAILREIGGTIVDIHGQHEHQRLMDSTLHLNLLDDFAEEKISASLIEYGEIFKKYQELLQRLNKFTTSERENAHRLDLIKFQLNEIREANLVIGEEEELEIERNELNNYERIYESLTAAYNGLQGEQKALDWLGLAMSNLETISNLNNNYEEITNNIKNSFYVAEDVTHSLRAFLDELSYSPDRLNEIEARLTVLNQLKRKYGQTISEIVKYGAEIEEEIEALENRETHLDDLQNKLSNLKKDLAVEADQLTALRRDVSKNLTKLIHQELKELHMEKTIFEIKFEKLNGEYTATGQDKIEFFISTNPGEPLKPLSRVASGGELSRIMLALKSIFSTHQGITSIIFDEVDTGVSGRVAQSIAEKIYKVSVGSQVLCISHLPQVAAMSDTHMFISKEVENKRTFTRVRALNKQEKIEEICRMISGFEITDLTKKHAKEMLNLADQQKQNP